MVHGHDLMNEVTVLFGAGTKISCTLEDARLEITGKEALGRVRRWVVALGGCASYLLMTFHLETFHLGKGSRTLPFLCLNGQARSPLGPTIFNS